MATRQKLPSLFTLEELRNAARLWRFESVEESRNRGGEFVMTLAHPDGMILTAIAEGEGSHVEGVVLAFAIKPEAEEFMSSDARRRLEAISGDYPKCRMMTDMGKLEYALNWLRMHVPEGGFMPISGEHVFRVLGWEGDTYGALYSPIDQGDRYAAAHDAIHRRIAALEARGLTFLRGLEGYDVYRQPLEVARASRAGTKALRL